MADLRIVDAPEIPTENITGEEKLPTGGNGNYSISLDSLADYTKTKKDLANNASVDVKVNGVRQELESHVEDLLNPHQVTKGQIGLGNVDNTADADKPVSNSTQAAIISAVAPKADKTYVDNALSSKSDKTYVATQLTLKANKTDVYAKLETYTKQESSDLVNNSISTALTPVNTSLDLAKRGVINRYDSSLTYNSGERVVLTNGDIVKSTIDGNANDPNVDMTGWLNTGNTGEVESVADLVAIQNPKDGQVVLVKSYNAPTNFALAQPYKGGGNFVFSTQSNATANNVNVFSAVGGKWIRLGWDSPTIYDAGILANGSDETTKFQALLYAAQNKIVSLCSKTVKLTQLDVPSNTYVKDGHLDFSISTLAPNYMNAYIVGANKNRAQDMEQIAVWDAASRLVNVTFENVEHSFPINITSWKNASIYQKCDNITYRKCKFNLQAIEALKFSGCIGKFLENIDSDLWQDVSVVDSYYNHNVVVEDCEFLGTNTKDIVANKWVGATGVRFVGTKDFKAQGNIFKNTVGGVWSDTFNDGGVVFNNRYVFNDAAFFTGFVNGEMVGNEFIGYYIGQFTKNIHAYDNYSLNAGYAGFYVESAKGSNIHDNDIHYDFLTNTAIAIIVQSNYLSDPLKPKGVSNIQIHNNSVDGAYYGVWINGTTAYSHKDIDIHDNEIKLRTPLSSVVIANALDIKVCANTCNGNIFIGDFNRGIYVDNNNVHTASNTAIRFECSRANSSDIRADNNYLKTNSGAVIYNRNTVADINMRGGLISNGGTGVLMQVAVGASSINAYDFIPHGIEQLVETLQLSNITLAVGSSTTLTQALVGVKSGWSATVRLHNQPAGSWLTVEAVPYDGSLTLFVKNNGAAPVSAFTTLYTIELHTMLNNLSLN